MMSHKAGQCDQSSLIDGVLLNPLAFRNSARLGVIWSDFSRLRGYSRALTAPALFFDWRERSQSFSGMAAFTYSNRTLTSFDQPLTPSAHEVTPNFFDVAGVQAFRGRTFLPDEGVPGKDAVALISYSLWRSAFGGSESTVGSSVELDGRSVRIVGILPPGYRPPNNGIQTQNVTMTSVYGVRVLRRRLWSRARFCQRGRRRLLVDAYHEAPYPKGLPDAFSTRPRIHR